MIGVDTGTWYSWTKIINESSKISNHRNRVTDSLIIHHRPALISTGAKKSCLPSKQLTVLGVTDIITIPSCSLSVGKRVLKISEKIVLATSILILLSYWPIEIQVIRTPCSTRSYSFERAVESRVNAADCEAVTHGRNFTSNVLVFSDPTV